jgi:hypothetical protein
MLEEPSTSSSENMKTARVLTLALGLAGLPTWAVAQTTCFEKTGEAVAACQKEEAAARQAEKRGDLQSGINYRDNALARCSPLSGADKDDCVRRVQGEGTASGSVEGGGIYRETRTITMPSPAGTDPAYTSSGSSR